MRLFPFRVQAAVVRQPQRHPAQPVMRAGQALFPVQPALRDGAAQRLALHVIRVSVMSVSSAADTSATRKPRWSSATTKPLVASRDRASRKGIAPLP